MVSNVLLEPELYRFDHLRRHHPNVSSKFPCPCELNTSWIVQIKQSNTLLVFLYRSMQLEWRESSSWIHSDGIWPWRRQNNSTKNSNSNIQTTNFPIQLIRITSKLCLHTKSSLLSFQLLLIQNANFSIKIFEIY